MIKEQDVREAIAEMQGQRNPNASTCIKLAAYYTILDHITDPPQREPVADQVSFLGAEPETVGYVGESDFAKAVDGKPVEEVLAVIDELMSTLQVMSPRLYNGVMMKL